MTREPSWAHTGAVLAGGRSSRMGAPKQGLLLEGRTLLEHAVAHLESMCAAVVVVGAEPGAEPARTQMRHLRDRRPDQGPLGGIESLLASGFDTQYLIVPCDLPLADREVLSALTAPTPSLLTVLRIVGEREPRPLPMRIAALALPRVRELLDQNRRAVRELLPEAAIVEVPREWAQRLVNVNTPQEYQFLTNQLLANQGLTNQGLTNQGLTNQRLTNQRLTNQRLTKKPTP